MAHVPRELLPIQSTSCTSLLCYNMAKKLSHVQRDTKVMQKNTPSPVSSQSAVGPRSAFQGDAYDRIPVAIALSYISLCRGKIINPMRDIPVRPLVVFDVDRELALRNRISEYLKSNPLPSMQFSDELDTSVKLSELIDAMPGILLALGETEAHAIYSVTADWTRVIEKLETKRVPHIKKELEYVTAKKRHYEEQLAAFDDLKQRHKKQRIEF